MTETESIFQPHFTSHSFILTCDDRSNIFGGFLAAWCVIALHKRLRFPKHQLSFGWSGAPQDSRRTAHFLSDPYVQNKQTFFWISSLRNNPLLGGISVLFAILSLLQQSPLKLSSLCSSLLVLAALSSEAPKTMKYCAHLIESSSHNVQRAISQTYVIPLLKLAAWKRAVIWLKWIDSPVSYCQCASGRRVFLISPEENASPPQQFF